MDPLNTIGDIVDYIEEHHSNPKAFNYLQEGSWRSISTESFLFDLKRLTYGLIAMGLKNGDKVGILAENSPFWHMADLAIIMAGGVSIPLFAKIASESFIYEVAQANVRFLFVQGADQWHMYDIHRNLFEKVIALDDPGEVTGANRLHEVLRKGELLWQEKPRLWDELKNQHHSDDIITIIYTAGSTGMPKGVQLSHQNLCHLVNFNIFNWDVSKDVYLNVLPLAHVFGRQIGLIMIAWGIPIYYLNDLGKLAPVCQEICPSLMIVVPRLLEKMYDAIEAAAKSNKNQFLRSIALWAYRLAKDPSESLIKNWILRPIANLIVYKQIRENIGDNWRVILCGGAAIDHGLLRFYLRCGVPVYEGWGLSEASTAVVNTIGNVKVGYVGTPLPGVKVRVADQNELLIGGPTVMKGYYRNPEATELAIDHEGWLHTGDKGEFDNEGRLRLTGRVKEQFKLSTGEYLSPSRIEHMLEQHPLVDLAMVIGEKRKYAACLLFPDLAAMKRAMKAENLQEDQFFESEYVKSEMKALLESVNNRIHAWEKIRKWKFILEAPTIEGGELTPTLRLKRDVILEKHHEEIESIYAED